MQQQLQWLGILLFLVAMYYSWGRGQRESFLESPERTIFVSIAQYRDSECPETVKQLYANAKHPGRIHVGVVQQNQTLDKDCLATGAFVGNVKMVRLTALAARGPTFARWLATTLYDKEDFFLQLDQHMRFLPDWDESLIQMYQSTGREKAVLSYYPRDFQDGETTDTDGQVPVTCRGHFEGDMVVMPESGIMKAPDKPVEVPFVAAGFIFAPGRLVADVPWDPNLPFLFMGEEYLLSMRFWTSGYNLYGLTKDLVKHHYTRSDQPKVWEGDRAAIFNELQGESKKRYRSLTGFGQEELHGILKLDLDEFGPGKERTVSDYFKYLGLDKDTKTVQREFCATTALQVQ